MFEVHAEVAKLGEAYALDMVDFAKATIDVDLDWSDASVEIVEEMANGLHQQYLKDNPPEEQVRQSWMMLGCYIGEVAYRNHGCTWGWITMDGNRFEDLQSPDGKLFWPAGKARGRLLTGSEDNLWHYFQVVVVGR
jgi:hypothetical protein